MHVCGSCEPGKDSSSNIIYLTYWVCCHGYSLLLVYVHTSRRATMTADVVRLTADESPTDSDAVMWSYLRSWPICWAGSQAPSSLWLVRSAADDKVTKPSHHVVKPGAQSWCLQGDERQLLLWEQELPSVCAASSQPSCSGWFSLCPQLSVLPLRTGPDGRSWTGRPGVDN